MTPRSLRHFSLEAANHARYTNRWLPPAEQDFIMIISHKHRFIFVKTMKTAGSSLEIALSKFCCEADVITPNWAEDEAIHSERKFRGPQNYQRPLSTYG